MLHLFFAVDVDASRLLKRSQAGMGDWVKLNLTAGYRHSYALIGHKILEPCMRTAVQAQECLNGCLANGCESF